MTAMNRFDYLYSEQSLASLYEKEWGFDLACSSKKKQERTDCVMDCDRS